MPRAVEFLPVPCARAYLDAGVQWYPVHDDERRRRRARLDVELRRQRDLAERRRYLGVNRARPA